MVLQSNALTTVATVQGELGSAASNTSRAVLERLINAASTALESAAGGRKFSFQSGISEDVPGLGGFHLQVRQRWPIKRITAINLLNPDQTIAYTFDPSTYQIDPRALGTIYRTSGAYGLTAGYSIGAQNVWGRMAGWPWLAQPGDDIRGMPQATSERPALQVCYDGGFVTPQQDLGPDGVTPLGQRDLPADIEEACLIAVEALWSRRGRSRDVKTETVQTGASTTYRDAPAQGGFLPAEAYQIIRRYAMVF